MQTVPVSLASEMRTISTAVSQQNQIDKEKEFKDHLKASKEIAEALIIDLPKFIKATANAGYDHAYLIDIDQYRPWRWEYSRKRGHPKSDKNLSIYSCKKFLMGVPRILALWALKNGFSVSITHPDDFVPEEIIAPFCDGKIYPNKLYINSKYLVISW